MPGAAPRGAGDPLDAARGHVIAVICCLVADTVSRAGALAEVARACSPRVAVYGDRVAVFDAGGLDGILGPPAAIAREVGAITAAQGLVVRIALAPTVVAAWLLAHAHLRQVVVDRATMAATLGVLPVRLLATLPALRRADGAGRQLGRDRGRDASRGAREALETFERWGLKTLAEVARLPRADVRARLGLAGVRLHQAACGEDETPLVPEDVPALFLERMVLEWPIEGLEPLSFVLSRLCDALSQSLERADRGAVAITARLTLVDRTTHLRTLHLPAPMRDAKTLRTLIALDLESHPPPAGIDDVTVEAEVAPGRIVQGSLLERSLPAPETLATLTARLGALMGENRIGAPVLPDTHDARALAQRPFDPRQASAEPEAAAEPVPVSLRRFRLPVPARVIVERGAPVRVVPASAAIPAGRVVERAGPWRSSGRWWDPRRSWDRDEWDVELAHGGCYRLARDRRTGRWDIEGEID